MVRIRMMLVGLATLSLLMVTAVQSADEKPRRVKHSLLAKGSIEDATLAKAAPANELITMEKDLEKLWKAWKVDDNLPPVDFKKEIVFIATTSGSRLGATPLLDDKGNLSLVAIATRDLAPGFRYLILSVPLDGVKTINGKELPK
jgi:hypothetical protein